MIYLLNLFLSVIYLYIFKQKKIKFLIFFPIFIIWCFILGFQFEVGTDYKSYLSMFEKKELLYLYFLKKEYIYYFFIRIFEFFGIRGQGYFLIIGFVQVFLYYFLQKKITYVRKKAYIYTFLYLTVGTTFYNQMNGIRSQTASYILSLMILNKIYYKKILYYIIGLNIHRSLLYFLPLVILEKILIKINLKKLKILLAISVLINFLPLIPIIKKLLVLIPRYSHYVDSIYLAEIPLILKFTKFIYLPIYWRSFNLELKNENENRLFKIGMLFNVLRTICLVSTITNRIGEYFISLTLIPLYYYFSDLKKDKKIKLVFIIFIISIFMLKVLFFPKAEYRYKSYLFN